MTDRPALEAAQRDILELCRHLSKLLGRGHWDIPDAFRKAADEIEHLRALAKDADRPALSFYEAVVEERDRLRAAAKDVERLREALEWIDRRAGLGQHVHDRIRAALLPEETKT